MAASCLRLVREEGGEPVDCGSLARATTPSQTAARPASRVGLLLLARGPVRPSAYLPEPAQLRPLPRPSSSSGQPPPVQPHLAMGRAHLSSETVSECEDPFDYVGSSSSWIRSSSKRDLRQDDTFFWIPLLSLPC